MHYQCLDPLTSEIVSLDGESWTAQYEAISTHFHAYLVLQKVVLGNILNYCYKWQPHSW